MINTYTTLFLTAFQTRAGLGAVAAWVLSAAAASAARRILAGKPGTFVQAPGAVFIHDSVNDLQIGADFQTATFANQGLTEFRSTGGLATSAGSGWFGTISNGVSGTFVKTGGGVTKLWDDTSKTYTKLALLGTMDISNGTLEVNFDCVAANVASWWDGAANTLKAGTWIVRPDGTGTLTRVGTDTTTDIVTIDTSAGVVLAGGIFNPVPTNGSSLTTVNGKFGVRNGTQFTSSGTVTVGASATLEFGLGSPDYPGGGGTHNTQNALIAAGGGGDISLNAATKIDIVNSGGLSAGRYLIVADMSGSVPTLNSMPAGFDINKARLEQVGSDLFLIITGGTVFRMR